MQQVEPQSPRQTSEQRGVVLVADLEVINPTGFAAWKPRAPECAAASATFSPSPSTSFKLEPQVVGVLCEIARISGRTESPSEALNAYVFANCFDQNVNGELAQ